MKNQMPKPHKLNRVVRVLLLPVMAILWLIEGARAKPRKKDSSKELQATLIMLEEEYISAR